MARYRRIEREYIFAYQWPGYRCSEEPNWFTQAFDEGCIFLVYKSKDNKKHLHAITDTGVEVVNVGDYIESEYEGSLKIHRKEVFENTFQLEPETHE